MSVNLNNLSIVSWIEGEEKHKCGYCKSENGSISNGMWAEQLTVEDYQDLIDRGWRRSGKYCYKPIMNQTCCPQYTIRCEALNISLSKSQKKLMKKLNKFLNNGELNEKDVASEVADVIYYETDMLKRLEPNIIIKDIKVNKNELLQKQEKNIFDGTGEPCTTIPIDTVKNESATNIVGLKETTSGKIYKKGLDANFSKLPCKKAKLLRIERKKEKLTKMGLKLEDIEKKNLGEKSIEEFIENVSENSKFKLMIRTFSCNELLQNKLEEEYDLYKKYQMIVHDDPPDKLTFQRFKRFLVNSPLKIKTERMTTSSETFHVSAELFAKYQMSVHNDPIEECDEVQFTHFLVHTPLKPRDFPNKDGPGFGSFHQQYWIDDKLVAVGVIDILPKCVSSVYFFYDPDYRCLSLGTYSSLREVYYTRLLQKNVPELCFYYMGFYIHSCPKMRYKGKITPSYLLCPETYVWRPIEKCIPLLEVSKYSRMNDDINAVDIHVPTNEDFLSTKIVYDHQFMSLATFKKMSTTANRLFNQIGLLVGRICLKNMVFWIQ